MSQNEQGVAGGSRGLVAPELLAGLDGFPSLTLSDELLAQVRLGMDPAALVANQPPLAPELLAVRREERLIPGRAGAPDVRVLVYTPPHAVRPCPAYLHIHGGGYVLGIPEISDRSNRETALAHGCVVASVDYRLAPETRFPGPIDDCYAALTWLAAEAESLGVDRARIAIGGESAGGGHAAALARLARNLGEIPICLQVLEAPMLDDRTGSEGADLHPVCGEFVWTPAANRFGWRALLGCEPGGPDVAAEAVPAREADLSGLPPTFIAVGALDLFLEEDLEYARRLTRAGVPVELHVIAGAYHGFSVAGAGAPQVQALATWRNAALARAFRR